MLNLLLFKSAANLRTEVSRYYLNYLWWIIEPILSMAVFYLVFGIFLNRGTEHYVAFLLVGLAGWNWFARSVQNISTSIYQARDLMQYIKIPKSFFPLEIFLQDAFKNAFVVALLLLFLIVYPTPVSITWLALPVIMAVQALLILATGMLCAALIPFVQDLKFIVSTAIHLLFFGSGVFYRIEDVVLPKHQFLLQLNPVVGLLRAYRESLIYATWPDWIYLTKVTLASGLLLCCAVWLLRRFDRVYPRICQQ
ncbi:ABC transporter permease [uncultured Pseudodesulfovibrio sp.]|uniref:ABC transporter permease n=1 Tax=uncultured Pseudodesulfovibrio sp. TaxID=2035858 RepID=UPI0029C9A1FE|nr:ABC transporter permease [uncultured Pseudodesulfovibrio sp.]